jgi:hypothetical protein
VVGETTEETCGGIAIREANGGTDAITGTRLRDGTATVRGPEIGGVAAASRSVQRGSVRR